MELEKTPELQKVRSDNTGPEAEVRAALRDFLTAQRSGNIQEIMNCYADDVVAFDLMPPLQVDGKQKYQKSWQMFADMCEFPVKIEQGELRVFAAQDVAFCHSLDHMSGKEKKSGETFDLWMRHTIGFRKSNGRWFIVHEQASVPIDMESNKALYLKPDEEYEPKH